MSVRLARCAGLASGAALLALSLATTASAAAPPAPRFSANVRADAAENATGQNEPQVAVDQTGTTFLSWQSSPKGVAMSSTVDGTSLTYLGNPNNKGGDVGDVDQATTTWPTPGSDTPAPAKGSNGLFFSELGTTTPDSGGCGAFQLINTASSDQGAHWNVVDTCQPLQVDRNWTTAYTPKQYRGTPDAVSHTDVYTEYHDFGASEVWVARSTDGGATYATPDQPAEQQGSPQALTTTCNTIPGGITVDRNGPHAGRVYAVWETSDQPFNEAYGCNYTQAEPFDHIFLSHSDDGGQTWTSSTVYNDPCAPSPPQPPSDPTACQDSSEIFTSTAVDDAGNVYVAYVTRHAADAHPEYDVYLATSTDGGQTFTTHRVNGDSGTHYFPWVAAAGDGGVDVAYYATDYVEGVGQFNKPAAAPPTAQWNVYLAQSLDAGQSFTVARVSDHPNYFGDVCTTGIFCGLAPSSFNWGQDRILFDDFGVAVGPDGGARLIWTDSRDSWGGTCGPSAGATVSCQTTHVYFSCQTSGLSLYGQELSGCGQLASAVVPESPAAALLLAGGAVAIVVAVLGGQRRRRVRARA